MEKACCMRKDIEPEEKQRGDKIRGMTDVNYGRPREIKRDNNQRMYIDVKKYNTQREK